MHLRQKYRLPKREKVLILHIPKGSRVATKFPFRQEVLKQVIKPTQPCQNWLELKPSCLLVDCI